jgi:hypothetical protein
VSLRRFAHPQTPFKGLKPQTHLTENDRQRPTFDAANFSGYAQKLWVMLEHIPSDDYEIWRNIGFALGDAVSQETIDEDEGLDLFDAWSNRSEKYPGRDEIKRRFKAFLKPGDIKLGTLVHLAKEHGYSANDQEFADESDDCEKSLCEPLQKLKRQYDACPDGKFSDSPYLQRKIFHSENGTPIFKVSDSEAWFPIYNVEGDFRGYERILADGSKTAAKGAKKSGAFYAPFADDPSTAILLAHQITVAEGVSDAITLGQAFRPDEKTLVLAALSATNLPALIRALRQRNPKADIVIARDNDPAGIRSAERAATENHCRIAIPSAKDFDEDRLNGVSFQEIANRVIRAAYPIPKIETALRLVLDEFRCDRYLDIAPPPRKFLVRDRIPANIVGAILGAGGSRKTTLLIQLAIAIATGMSWADGLGEIEHAGGVLYLVLEDDSDELHRRLWMVIAELANDETEQAIKAAVRQNLFIRSLVGQDNALVTKRGNQAEKTKRVEQIIELATQIENLRLIVVEPVSRIFNADENNASDMSRLVEVLEEIREATGATVLVAHHISKAALRERETSQVSSRGSSALIDGIRWAAQLRTADKKEVKHSDHTTWVKFDMVKSNYCRLDTDLWLHAKFNGYLRRADPQKISEAACLAQIRDRIEADAKNGTLWTISGFVRQYGGVDGPFGVGKDKLDSEIRDGLNKGWFQLEDKIEAAVRFPEAAREHRNKQQLLTPNETAEVIELPRRGS